VLSPQRRNIANIAQNGLLSPDPAERGPHPQSAIGEDDPGRGGEGDEEDDQQQGHRAIFRLREPWSITGTARLIG
jgi:hypothetical protein